MQLLIELDESNPNTIHDLKHLRDILLEIRRNAGSVNVKIAKHSSCYANFMWPATFHNVKVKIIIPKVKSKPKIRNSSIFRFPRKVH